MSEEDAALFWEIGNNPAHDPEGVSVGPMLSDRAAPIVEEAAPEIAISIRPVPNNGPDDSRCMRDRPDDSRCMKDGLDDPRCTDVCDSPDNSLHSPRAGVDGSPNR